MISVIAPKSLPTIDCQLPDYSLLLPNHPGHCFQVLFRQAPLLNQVREQGLGGSVEYPVQKILHDFAESPILRLDGLIDMRAPFRPLFQVPSCSPSSS